jgi:AcrR family transcriptional regulator
MSIIKRSLASRHSDLTRRVILDGAVELLERAPVRELSVRAVARNAGTSERTVFRYFATRDELLDAVANEVSRRLDLPPHPSSVDELLEYPKAAYARFEATAALTKAALHSELYHRIRSADAERRGAAIRQLIDRVAPTRPERERKLTAANIRYYLIATTWHYYRFYFGLSLEESIECAQMAIAQALRGLGMRAPPI